jgi:TRAP-type C4-dicarboxylate transport system substrate-binding protein
MPRASRSPSRSWAGRVRGDCCCRASRTSNPYPAQIIFCRKPIKDLADLKGRKVRPFGLSLDDLVIALGATPVSLAYAETYVALERGVVDCAITGSASGNAAKWYEVTAYEYTLPLSWAVSGYYTNLAWWNKVAPDVRRFLEATWKELENREWQFGGVELT